MTSARRLVRPLASAGALGLLASGLGGCTLIEHATSEPVALAAIEFDTFNPWEPPDGGGNGPHTQDDPAELDRVEAILEAHRIRREDQLPERASVCLDAFTIGLDLRLEDGEVWELSLDDCDGEGSFRTELYRIALEWDEAAG